MSNYQTIIPANVPKSRQSEYRRNYDLLTNQTGRLFLIAGDQKVEHLNRDFFGSGIPLEDATPEHLFKIAAASHGGVLATHPGLITSFGPKYSKLPYIIKLNGKTNLGHDELKYTHKLWLKVADVVKLKKDSGLNIVAIGYTLYLGGFDEENMLATVSQAIFQAHQAGLAAVVWVYPRGPKINEENIHTIAGGAGIAAALGADFVKIKYPFAPQDRQKTAVKFKEAVLAAGQTKVICVGGAKRPVKDLLKDLERQIKISGTNGLATGRNLHQRTLAEATKLSRAIGAIIFKNKTAAEAWKIYNK